MTVIEYASLTCHHCQNFHKTTWPSFKAKYVDTGKVRFRMREFPLDPLATAGFMLARCAGEDKWYPVVDMLDQPGMAWNRADKPFDALVQVMRQAGMDARVSRRACGTKRPIPGSSRLPAGQPNRSRWTRPQPSSSMVARKSGHCRSIALTKSSNPFWRQAMTHVG